MPATRQSWEPARVPYFFAGLAAAQNVITSEKIVHAVIATNKGGTATTMAISINGTQRATLAVPANATAALPLPSSGLLVQSLSVTPAAALDVTVLAAS